MGDKSPKAKQRQQNQKKTERQQRVADAKSKQDAQNRAPLPVKGKKDR